MTDDAVTGAHLPMSAECNREAELRSINDTSEYRRRLGSYGRASNK